MVAKLRTVAQALLGKKPPREERDPTRLNARIIERLSAALGPTDGSLEQVAQRGEFAWFLYETVTRGFADVGESDPEDDGDDTDEHLVFPRPDRRLKGIGAFPEPVATILETLEFVAKNKAKVSAVVDFIVSQHPNVQPESAKIYLRTMWNTLEMFQVEGEILGLSLSGRRFLDTEKHGHSHPTADHKVDWLRRGAVAPENRELRFPPTAGRGTSEPLSQVDDPLHAELDPLLGARV